MMSSELAENRRFARKNHQYQFTGRWSDGNGNENLFGGMTADISHRGLRIITDRSGEIAPGDRINIKIKVFFGEPPVRVMGRVVWRIDEENSPDDLTSFGVELTGIAGSIRSYEHWLEVLAWN